MPLNVNDADLSPKMAEPPVARIGFTDMTFCLVGFELANIFRRIVHEPPRPTNPNNPIASFESLDDDQKEKWIKKCHQRMEETYLANADLTVPPIWAAATLTRLVMSKTWLMAYHPFQRLNDRRNLSQRIKDKLLLVSVESIEYANQLDNDPRTRKWSWLFATYFQWHSLAFLLLELCNSTQGELVERAWQAIEVLVQTRFGDAQSDPRRAIRWHAMKRLMLKARMARDQAIRAEQCLLPPEVAQSGANYPAIDLLLGWKKTPHTAQEQHILSTPNERSSATLAASSQTTPENVAFGAEEDMSMFFNMDFDWTMMDIDTSSLPPRLPQLQRNIDPRTQQLEPECMGHDLASANEPTTSEPRVEITPGNGVQYSGSINEMGAWYCEAFGVNSDIEH